MRRTTYDAAKHQKIDLLKFLMSQCTKTLPNNLLYDIKNVFVQGLAQYIKENKWGQVGLTLDTKTIDINYNDGDILKKLLPEQHFSEKDTPDDHPLIGSPDDYKFIRTLVKNYNLDIHADNNYLLHAMISREQISMIKYILEEGWKTFVLNKEDNTLDKLYNKISDYRNTGGDKYNTPTYHYLEEVYIVRSAQYNNSFFPYGSIQQEPLSNTFFQQAVNMTLLHNNISYLIGLIKFQKKQCGGEDEFYKKFNDFLMDLVRPETLSIIFIKGRGALFEEPLFKDLILYNTKIKDVSNVRYIIPHIHNIETLRKCINRCLTQEKNKDLSTICDMAQERILEIRNFLRSQRDEYCKPLVNIDIKSIIDIKDPKDSDVQKLRLLCKHHIRIIGAYEKISELEDIAFKFNEYANEITISNKGNTNSNKDKMKSILLASELVIRGTFIGMYETHKSMMTDFNRFCRNCSIDKLKIAIDALERVRLLLAWFRNAMTYDKGETTANFIQTITENLAAKLFLNNYQQQSSNDYQRHANDIITQLTKLLSKKIHIVIPPNNDNEQMKDNVTQAINSDDKEKSIG